MALEDVSCPNERRHSLGTVWQSLCPSCRLGRLFQPKPASLDLLPFSKQWPHLSKANRDLGKVQPHQQQQFTRRCILERLCK